MCRRPVRTHLLVLGILWLGMASATRASAAEGVRYRGRLASDWIAELRDADVETRRAAFAAAIEVEPGIHLLIPALGDGLQDPDAQVRVRAAETLGRLRRYYVEAFPLLLAAIRNADPTVRLAAIGALEPAEGMSDCRVVAGPVRPVRHRDVEIPSRAVAAVAGGLNDDDARVRVAAARVLAALGRRADPGDRAFRIAVPALAGSLADPDPVVRGAVLDALDRLYSPNDREYFLRALDDPDPGVRRHAAIGLAGRGLVPGRTIPLLAEILSSEEVTMKRRAIDALRANLSLLKRDASGEESTATDLAAAAAGVRAALKSGDELVRITALHAVGDLGPLAATLVPEVSGRLEDESQGVRWLASEVLKQIAPEGSGRESPPVPAPSVPAPTSPVKVEGGRVEDFVRDLENPDPARRFRAAAELFNMGDGARPALPALIEKLTHSDPWVRVEVLRIVGHLTKPDQDIVPAIVGALHDPDPAVRFLAATLLCKSFPERSEPAIPVLMAMVLGQFPPGQDASISCGSDPQTASNAGRREAAFRAFRWIPSSTPGLATALTRLLDSSEAEIRTFASAELARTGAESLRASPALRGLLSDTDAQVRANAAAALGRSAAAGDPTRPPGEGRAMREALTVTLLDPSPTVRAESARGLGAFGPSAADAVPALLRTMKDPEIDVRAAAAEALGRIGRGTREVTDLLAWAALEEGDAFLRKTAAEAVWKIDPHPDRLLARCLGALRDPETFTNASAAMDPIGSRTTGVAKPLREALADPSPAVRRVVASTIGRLGLEAPSCVPALAERVARDDDTWVRNTALEAIARIGPGAGAAAPAILDVALHDVTPEMRWQAALVFWRLGPVASRTIPAIVDSIHDERSLSDAVVLLQTMGGSAGEAGPALVAALGHPNPYARRWAAMALDRPGAHPPAALPALVLAGKSGDFDLKIAVMQALGALGPDAAPAVPFLADALADPQEGSRMVAALTLARIGPAARAARQALLANLQDPSGHVREAVAGALQAIGP